MKEKNMKKIFDFISFIKMRQIAERYSKLYGLNTENKPKHINE